MNWKRVALVCTGVLLAGYMVLALTAFNKPDEDQICQGVNIHLEEDIVDGFLTANDVQRILTLDHINPQGLSMTQVNLRLIEETLQAKELIDSVECYKGQDGRVCINICQRIPVIRVMNNRGENYYVDSHGKPMPGTDYPCNLIVATGDVSKPYAEKWLTPIANIVLRDPFWKSQIVQLNVLADGSIEMIPRVGDHVVYLGQPVDIEKKLNRLRKFYVHGLNVIGWNKYKRINVEFSNQIVCKRK